MNELFVLPRSFIKYSLNAILSSYLCLRAAFDFVPPAKTWPISKSLHPRNVSSMSTCISSKHTFGERNGPKEVLRETNLSKSQEINQSPMMLARMLLELYVSRPGQALDHEGSRHGTNYALPLKSVAPTSASTPPNAIQILSTCSEFLSLA